MSEASPLHVFSQSMADLVERARLGLVLPHPTRVPVSGVVWKEDRVLTAAHAMGGRSEGKVLLADGTERAAKILAKDPTLDLALLEVSGAEPGPAPWAESSVLRVGELALAVGVRGVSTPTGVSVAPVMSMGPVALLAGPWRSRGGATVARLIEVDASLPMGASGGVLISTDGRLIGLNTHGLRHGGATIPVETLREAVERLEQGGSVRPGYLGVGVQPARVVDPTNPKTESADEGESTEDGRRDGVLINAVRPGSPAEAGGLLVGDILLSIDGESVPSYRAMRAILLGRGGQRVQVELVRGGSAVQLEVEIGQRDDAGGGPFGRHRRRGRRGGPWAN